MQSEARSTGRTWATTTVCAAVAASTFVFATPQQPTFRSGVDLVAVDVQVVDRNGHPLTALGPEQFDVQINGRRRRVISADLVQHTRMTPSEEFLSPARQFVSARPEAERNQPRSGRVFVIAVDVSSFSVGESRNILGAAREFLRRLEPEDYVGVFTFPLGPRLDPTLDHASVGRRLDQIVGQKQSLMSEFHLSPAEVIDINAETASMQASTIGRGGTAVTGAIMPGDGDTLRRVQARECNSADVRCIEQIRDDAQMMGLQLEGQVTDALSRLRELMGVLAQAEGRKTVVVLSAGMPVSDRPGGRPDVGELPKILGQDASRANATIYALQMDNLFFNSLSAETRKVDRFPVNRNREAAVNGRVLDEFAGASGGAVLPILTGSGEYAFERVLRETSSHYLLAVQPEEVDRDGKLRQLRVRVNQSGATIRSRMWVVIPKRSTT